MDALKLSILMLCTVLFVETAEALRCYTCTSVDGSVPACEIPFNPTGSSVREIDCNEFGTGKTYCRLTMSDGSGSGVRLFMRTCVTDLTGSPPNDCTSADGSANCYCSTDLCNDDKILNAATNTKIAIPLVASMVLIKFVF